MSTAVPTYALSDLFPETLAEPQSATPTAPPTLAEFEQWLVDLRYTAEGEHRANVDAALFALWDFLESGCEQ